MLGFLLICRRGTGSRSWGMLVVLAWHSCLRLLLPSEGSLGLLSPSDQALVLNRRLATSHRAESILVGVVTGLVLGASQQFGGNAHNPHSRGSLGTEVSLPAPARVHSSHIYWDRMYLVSRDQA